MTSRIPSVLQALAARLGVNDGEFYVLLAENIDTADELYSRIPNEDSMEDYIKEVLFLNEGIQNPDGSNTHLLVPRNSTLTVPQFTRGSEAAQFRRLWRAAKDMAIEDLKNLAQAVTGASDSSSLRKVNTSLVMDLREKARARGITDTVERATVGDQCIMKVLNNFQPFSGLFAYQEFEEFTTQEEEDFAKDKQIKTKDLVGMKLVRGEGNYLRAAETQEDLRKADLNVGSQSKIILAIMDVFELKARAYDIAEVCEREINAALHDVYISAMRETPQAGFRVSTFNEVRKFDRLLVKDILYYLKSNKGSYGEGIKWFLSPAGLQHNHWRLLDQQIESMPDRGIDRPPPSLSTSHEDEPRGTKRLQPQPPSKPPDGWPKGFCEVCGKHRDDHPNRRFCERESSSSGSRPQPPPRRDDARTKQKPGGKGKGGGDGKGKSGRDRPGVPSFMKDNCAELEPPSATYRKGRQYCFNYHDRNKGCKNGAGCPKSHRCPKFKRDGTVCNAEHPVYEHKE